MLNRHRLSFKEITKVDSNPLLEIEPNQIEITGGTRTKTATIKWVKRADKAISEGEVQVSDQIPLSRNMKKI